MVKELIHDPLFLSIKAKPASPVDIPVAQNLQDTLLAHRETCVGMAANMIGVAKQIIAFLDGTVCTVMYNPVITARSKPYTAEEGCLSLSGDPRKTTRWAKITVQFQDAQFRRQKKTYTGFTAQIIQHEIDHCNGILI